MTPIKAVRGMNDLFGETQKQWEAIEAKIRKILADFGFQEIRTPVLEHIEVFKETVGDDSDIVQKQMYQVMSDKQETLVMRPEGTAAFIRAVLEHQLHQTGKPQRYYYYLPMFRHERPQKGRLRQFHQFGAELINDASPEADVEIISVLHHIYQSLGLKEYEIRINSVGCNDCRPQYKAKLIAFLKPKKELLCEQCQLKLERSPLRVLDCKKESCKVLVKDAPKFIDHLCENCKTHHTTVKKRFSQLAIPVIEDTSIVRGLDYYTRTAFEFTSTLLGSQDALVGGGRYDGLSVRFGEKPFPAVGFGMGMERLMIALEEKKLLPQTHSGPDFFFAALGEAAFDTLYPIAFQLKQKGVKVEMGYDSKSLKAQLKHADKSNSKYTLILGDTELQTKKVPLKEMATGKQEEISLDELTTALLRRMPQ
jgi:histidyl-tRNA synthetase